MYNTDLISTPTAEVCDIQFLLYITFALKRQYSDVSSLPKEIIGLGLWSS